MVEIARKPDLDHFALQMRYLRGRTSIGVLQRAIGAERTVSPLDAALFSSFGMGIVRSCSGMEEEELRHLIERNMDDLKSRLRCP
jgi:hypothetical protein